MATAKEIEALQRAAAEADVTAQIDLLQATSRDDVLDGETKAEVKGLGLQSAPVKATNGANILVRLYHAYDGREIEVPRYQAPRYVAGTRFPRNDDTIPEEYWNKPVWGLTPDHAAQDDDPHEFQCRLSVHAPNTVKDEMRAAGLNMTCRKRVKGGGFNTQFEADEHFRVKHPRRWAAYQRFLQRDTQNRNADAMLSAVQAMQRLAATTTEE